LPDIQGEKMATLAQLENQIQKLQRRADKLREQKSSEVIANIHALMQEYGLTVSDLGKSGAAGVKRRGRPAGSKNAPKATAKSAAKTGKFTKMPAKYRDPVSGLTWSGHARPPAWIKDAPDRSVFLINGAAAQKKSATRGRPAAKKSVKRAGAAATKKTSAKRARAAQSAQA
jgi:DNA-binding protein H-NS